MKMKKTTWKDIKRRFSGLARTKYDVETYETKFGGFLKLYLILTLVYNRKKDCTYMAVTPNGFLDISEPSKDEETIVLRYEGKVPIDEFDEGGRFREDLRMVCEETLNNYNARLEERRSSEED